MHKYVRDHTTDNLKCFAEDLDREKWGDITSATNVDVAYEPIYLIVRQWVIYDPLRFA